MMRLNSKEKCHVLEPAMWLEDVIKSWSCSILTMREGGLTQAFIPWKKNQMKRTLEEANADGVDEMNFDQLQHEYRGLVRISEAVFC